jgi:hypothetical protein
MCSFKSSCLCTCCALASSLILPNAQFPSIGELTSLPRDRIELQRNDSPSTHARLPSSARFTLSSEGPAVLPRYHYCPVVRAHLEFSSQSGAFPANVLWICVAPGILRAHHNTIISRVYPSPTSSASEDTDSSTQGSELAQKAAHTHSSWASCKHL